MRFRGFRDLEGLEGFKDFAGFREVWNFRGIEKGYRENFFLLLTSPFNDFFAEGRCVDKAPIWCHQHKMHCHTKWIESFKKFCAKSCGYCGAPTGKSVSNVINLFRML